MTIAAGGPYGAGGQSFIDESSVIKHEVDHDYNTGSSKVTNPLTRRQKT